MKKHIRKLFWFGIPLLILIFVWWRWDNWFSNEPEPLYTSSPIPDRVLLSWSADPTNSRDVTWQGDTLTNEGFLQILGESSPADTILYKSSPKIIRTSGGAASYFKVAITKLSSGQTYRYRVANGANWSDWFTFKIENPINGAYSFIYIGDVQDSVNGVSGELFHRAYADQPNAAFMMFIGDMIERPHDAYWGVWFKSGGTIFQTLPIIATPGNHEYYKGLIQTLDERWMAHFPFPQNGPPNFLGRTCYWDYQNTRFISIDSNGIQTIPSALEHRNWLRSVLENTHQRWIVVMMHHPLYSTSRGRDYFYFRWLFKSLFDQYKVDLVLQGHDHAYGRLAHIENTENKEKQGPVYVVTHASPKLYDVGFSPKMDKLATNTQMYQLLDVSTDSIRCKIFTSDGTYFDGFTISKNSSGDKSVTEHAPLNSDIFLQPTKSFIRKSSGKELEKYNKDMLEWEKSKLK
ncbi:MAG: metallophosphoesterase family protein [Mariniphaga sp.]